VLFAVVLVLASFLRFNNLDTPRTLYFDETYYTKDAWTQLLTGFSRTWTTSVDEHTHENLTDSRFAAGEVYAFNSAPSFVVHPPLGKAIISVGFVADKVLTRIAGADKVLDSLAQPSAGGADSADSAQAVQYRGIRNPASWRLSTAFSGVANCALLMLATKLLLQMVLSTRGGGGSRRANTSSSPQHPHPQHPLATATARARARAHRARQLVPAPAPAPVSASAPTPAPTPAPVSASAPASSPSQRVPSAVPARRPTLPEWFALFAGVVLAIDGLAITMSRIGILDNILTCLVLASFLALLHYVKSANTWYDLTRFCNIPVRASRRLRAHTPTATVATTTVARLSIASASTASTLSAVAASYSQNWLLLMSALIGAAAGVKWSAVYFFAAFSLIGLSLYFRKRPDGLSPLPRIPRPTVYARISMYISQLARPAVSAVQTALRLVVTFAGTYILCWLPWFWTPTAYNRSGTTAPLAVIGEFIDYHKRMLNFHEHLESTHPYSAKAITWLLQLRPTSFYYKTPNDCGADRCSAAITSLGNPLIWWVGVLAFAVLIAITIKRPTICKLLVLLPILAGWLPWAILYSNRTIFTFYAIVFLPYICLAISLILFCIATTLRSNSRRYLAVLVVLLLVIFMVVSHYFYPIWTAQHISYEQWHDRMWFKSWI
jgi:dolichyl-phosphate-mannose--protein O-mannosyl transferase